MKRKIVVLVVTLLMCLTAIVIVPNDLEVEATPGERSRDDGGIGLDLDFMWNVTKKLSNVVHQYPDGMIPKGRAWGTWGDNYTAREILKPNMEGACGLSDVQKLLIGYIDEDGFRDRKYSNKIVTKDFSLSFTHPTETYPYETPVPVTEIFPIPSGYPHRIIGGQMTHNYSFTDAHVYRLVDLTENRSENWPFGGTYNNYSLNVSGEVLNAYDLAIGNVSYLASNESPPTFQDGMVFMLDEEQGCEDKLENITNATACILVHNTSRGYQYQNATEATFSVVRIESDADNLTAVIDMLNNGEFMLVDNVLDSETFTFTYNLTEQNCIPTHDYFLLTQIRDPCITKYQYDDLEYAKTVAVGLYALNLGPFNLHHCHGIILYDSFDTHFMSFAVRDWKWFQGVVYSNGPALPMFSVNYSVGNWLDETITLLHRPIASGYLDQEYREQTPTTPGVDSYNVVGYRNITHSPNDNSVVISNRYDGWWGETPGDSGTGAGIVLGIAKYFNDYNITPKYNLTFLMTTGEEYGMRGAQHFYDSHSDEHHILWIGLDMVAFDQIGTNVSVLHTNETMSAIISAIANETDYPSKVDNKYGINITSSEGIGGTETYVWKNKCDCIAFGKDNQSIWRQYHRAGANYSKGDSLNHIDRNDANATFELVWNVTKYFTVNPDCWFEGDVCYESFDSPSDGDALVDSIRANFTVNTSLPQDKVKVTLFYQVSLDGKETSWMEASSKEYVVTSNGTALSTVFSLPDSYASADSSVRLKVYNSTARINDLAGIGSTNENDTSNSSEKYRLYHPLGYPHQGAASTSTNDRITGSVFTANENCSVNNITAYVYSPTCYPPYTSKGVIYQADDLTLIGETDERAFGTAYGGAWKVYPFSDPKPSLEKDTEYIIALWSEGTQLYYDTFNSERGRYNESTYGSGPPEDPVFINESRLYSLYCSYTPFAPKILAVSADPPVVGFGCNVTISADVIGEVSGVDAVAVNISYPDSTWYNVTMENTEENNYSFICSDTWLVGQYNYTIWAWGTGGNSNSSSGHSFNISAQATISIATLKDSYGDSEYINITDPPTPPDDFYLVDRGLTWDEYYNALTGENVLEITAGPTNYQDENNEWTPINCTIDQLEPDHPAYSYGYRAGNERGLYNTYFKPNVQDDWPIAFAYNKSTDPVTHVIRSKLVGVGYLDPSSNWAYEYLQNVQSSQGQIHGNSVTYEDVFTGTDVTWSYESTKLKEDIIMSNATKTLLQNHPPSDYGLSNESSYLVFITRLDYHNLNMHNTSGVLNGNFTASNGRIDFKDAMGHIKCSLPIGEAYELHNEEVRQQLTYRIIQHDGEYYLLSGLKVSDLNEMQFPVVIDPDLSMMTVYSTTSDGYIYKYNSNYNTAWTSSTGTVIDSVDFIRTGQYKNKLGTYYIWRGFLFFNTSSLPSNAYITQATLSVYKKSDSSSTDFDIVIQNGQPTYPHDPLQIGDYNKNYYSGNGGSLNTANFSNGRNNIPLTNYSWLTKEGMTKLCLRSSRDISGTPPSGLEYVQVYSSEKSGTFYDPKLSISYRNQSKIKNTGSTSISGYLLIQVQYDNETLGEWVVDHDTINETTPRTINSGEQLVLDIIFNGQVNTDDLSNGDGTYRVYTAFRDPGGNILQTEDETYLVSSYEFDVTFA